MIPHSRTLACRAVTGTGVRVITVVVLLSGLSGCMSSRYKLTKDTQPPIVPFNIGTTNSEQPAPVAVTLETVIVLRGPGSWKRDAYWDEYRLALTNLTSAPVVVDSAVLTALGPNTVRPESDPWKLEKASRSAMAYNFGLAKDVTVRVGTGVLAVAGGTVAGIAAGGGFWAASSAVVFSGTVLFAAPVIGGTIYRNITGRRKVEAEFNRLRLPLPVTLEPGQTLHGSLFFRITPGPQEMTLVTRAGGVDRPVILPLQALSDLHLRKE